MAHNFTASGCIVPSSSKRTVRWRCRIETERGVFPMRPNASPGGGEPAQIIGELGNDDTALT